MVVGIRTNPDKQILSYDLETDSTKFTNRHRKYIQKLKHGLPISVHEDIRKSGNDDSEVSQASGMPDVNLWTRAGTDLGHLMF